MWQCPRCGHWFFQRNLWHSCADVPLDHHFAGRPGLRRLFDAWLAFVRENGPLTVSSNRTRIALTAQVRFAGCVVRKDHLLCNFVLDRPVRDPRIVQIKEEVPGWWAHRFALRDPKQLDGVLRRLVRESYREFGMRERLKREPKPRGAGAQRSAARRRRTSAPGRRPATNARTSRE
jgi:hypothetical protein